MLFLLIENQNGGLLLAECQTLSPTRNVKPAHLKGPKKNNCMVSDTFQYLGKI